MHLGKAWKCDLSGIHLSTQGPNGFRESTVAPRLGADAEIELGASARQRSFLVVFCRAGRLFMK
jgi:hypothetical protein